MRRSIPIVLANLVPVAGVLWWGWQVQQVVFLYWLENLVIGAYNALAILACEPLPDRRGNPRGWFDKVFTAVFFVAHYGAFCAVHALVLAFFFSGGEDVDLQELGLKLLLDPMTLLALLGMIVSYGLAYYRELQGGEFRGVNIDKLTARPYPRILVTHFFILAGGVTMLKMQGGLVPIAIFIAIKTLIDLYFQKKKTE